MLLGHRYDGSAFFDKLALPQKLLRFPWGLEVLTLKPTEVFYAVGANDAKDQRSTFASRAGCGSRFAFHAARTTLIIRLRIMGLYDVSVRHSFVRHYGSTVSAEVPLVAKLGAAVLRPYKEPACASRWSHRRRINQPRHLVRSIFFSQGRVGIAL